MTILDRDASSGRLVCLAQPKDPSRHGVVSELAAWLHRNNWEVEIVASNELDTGWARVPGAEPQVLGMAFRLRRLSPWLVHAFDPSDAQSADAVGAPYLLSLNSAPRTSTLSLQPAVHRRFEAALSSAARVVCSSRVEAARLLEIFGCRSDVVPDGVDTQSLGRILPHRSRPLIVCCSDWMAEPDHTVLARAFAAAAASTPDVALAVAGRLEGTYYTKLLEAVPASLRGRVLVLDNTDRRRLLSLYARAHVTCVPTPSRAPNRTLVESLAVGTAVVCADGGSAAEVIDEDAVAIGAGMRFKAGDPDDCASCLVELLDRAADGGTAACRSRAFLYDWSFVGPRLIELYKQAVA
jgi:glycosyltransferase involved in cell wall biosynthesis